LRLIIIDGAIISLIIYGDKLYYSKENDCAQNEKTALLAKFMLIIL
jgi:hypothetical protein